MSNFRILIVDDSKIVVKMIEKCLSGRFSTDTAFNGDEAIQKLDGGEHYNVIILDLMMPGKDGFEVLRHLKHREFNIKKIIITAQPRSNVEKEVNELGADHLFIKPFDYFQLIDIIEEWHQKSENFTVTLPIDINQDGEKLPFKTIKKHCFICGYEDVRYFEPIEGAYSEAWSTGLYPTYSKQGDYALWDFLKNFVAVCPYCFFASSDSVDFANRPGQPFPYLEDAKKILSRTIPARKKMVSGALSIDERFNNPNRDLTTILDSLKLAEKCMNGLILGAKEGTHCQLGYYQLMQGALDFKNREPHYGEALESFNNQLRESQISGEILVKSSYFLTVLYMALGKSSIAKKVMQGIAVRYNEKNIKKVTGGERVWLKKISTVWEEGVDPTTPRVIEEE